MTDEASDKDPRVVLVTGTSSGLGLLTAVELARRGARVFASMRDTSRAGPLREAAAAAGADLDVVELDVTRTASVEAAVERVLGAAGRVDVVVNNAAVGAIGPIEFMSDAEIEGVVGTNLMGPIRVIRAVLPAMRRRGEGRIVNVSSGSARTRAGVRLLGLYAASKAALHALTLDLNKELAPLGVRVVLVEGGVAGPSKINDAIMERVATFGQPGAPYVVAERIAAAQMRWMSRAMPDGSAAAKMIADACTVSDPGVRFPPEAQQPLDWADRLSDRDYLKLCALDDVDRTLSRNRLSESPWRIKE